MAGPQPEVIQLRRKETSTSWGFNMQGGRDVGLPIFMATVSPKSIAGHAGVMPGDAILKICETNVMQFTNAEAKKELLRAGNELDFTLIRNAVNPKDPAVKAACGVGKKRGTVEEESIDPHMNEGSQYRNVKPKSYQMLEAQLGPQEGGAPAPSALGQQVRRPPQQLAHMQTPPQAAPTGPVKRAPAGGGGSSGGGSSGGGRALTMKDVLDVKLAEDMNNAIDTNDLARLKALLNHPSLNLGVVDDAVAAGYMESLRNLKEDTGLRHIDNASAARPPGAGPAPGSIFDRKVDDRSDYLKAQGQTIQKAYGQTDYAGYTDL